MAYLLMFVTLLHLITLAMLFIATMEKVVLGQNLCLIPKCPNIQLYVSCPISLWSPGGSGTAWRTQTYGTTVGLTTSQEPGCVHPPKKLVGDNSFLHISIKVTWTEQGKSEFWLWECFLRLASGSAGPDGPLCGLLLCLLFGVSGSTLHHVQGWTLLLHWALSSLRW